MTDWMRAFYRRTGRRMRAFIVFWWIVAVLIPLTWIGRDDGPSLSFLAQFYTLSIVVTAMLWIVAGVFLKISEKA
ncbi:hypothetical protein OF829_01275 [Sphingomonas sp. LB-2]|uniref:hypothetical protein n=1 Tax=Sphingomonas caeni TaxID=2984949 RepID=UPI002230013C|nr:hypothetical protein [Sphingomonas caeni]MCW3845854.1 hypothetical protein [Sphingomonas caeni]